MGDEHWYRMIHFQYLTYPKDVNKILYTLLSQIKWTKKIQRETKSLFGWHKSRINNMKILS